VPDDHNEAFARVKIDRALGASGWDLLDDKAVALELHGGSGRADYVLKGQRGALCVLEAKKEGIDPYDAKEQAREYAEEMNAPFIILSNGDTHYFWNHLRTDQDAYLIESLPSRDDLERLILKNMRPPKPLSSEALHADWLKDLRPDITLRNYQLDAINAVSNQFENQNKKRFLLEMATGTGKTILSAALIRRFLLTRNAERVLFIVDRIDLATQTLEDFDVILKEYSPCLYKTARRKPAQLLGSCVVVATLQSLMVNRRFRDEFTPFYFDMVINDEAHRSIYGDAREVVHFFQATRIGLTATPKAYLANVDTSELASDNPRALEARQMRDTYHYFGCKPGQPSFRYDIIDAVNDEEGPFLCLPKIFDMRTDITNKSLEENGWTVVINEQEESYKVRDLEKKVFTPARNELMVKAFLDKAQKDPSGQLGKSIIFAVNQHHATELTKIFNRLQPNSAITITSRVKKAQSIGKDFRDGKRSERIAVSVDMLTTGYNCKDLLNIGLMRPIFSPTEYVQIKGRGTRLYTFEYAGKKYEKERYHLIDFCAVCEYFEEEYDYTEPLKLPRERGSTDDPTGGSTSSDTIIDGEDGLPPDIINDGDPPPDDGIPVWTGTDILVEENVKMVGPDGEKVDRELFRGTFETDLRKFAEEDGEMRQAIEEEDDDTVETIMQERFYNQPQWYYSPEKLVFAYDVPAHTPAFVYKVLNNKPLPQKEELVDDTVDSISARFNLRYTEQKWLRAVAHLVAEDKEALKQFIDEDIGLYNRSQFRILGGAQALANLEHREEVFDALRESPLVERTVAATKYAVAA
jgi:type I restriction enzyme, R subunit